MIPHTGRCSHLIRPLAAALLVPLVSATAPTLAYALRPQRAGTEEIAGQLRDPAPAAGLEEPNGKAVDTVMLQLRTGDRDARVQGLLQLREWFQAAAGVRRLPNALAKERRARALVGLVARLVVDPDPKGTLVRSSAAQVAAAMTYYEPYLTLIKTRDDIVANLGASLLNGDEIVRPAAHHALVALDRVGVVLPPQLLEAPPRNPTPVFEAGLEEGWGVARSTAADVVEDYEAALGDLGDPVRLRKVGWERDEAAQRAAQQFRAIQDIAEAQPPEQRARTLAAARAFRDAVEIYEAAAWHRGEDRVETTKRELIAALQGRDAAGLEEETVLPPGGPNPFAADPVPAGEHRVVTDPIRIYYTDVTVETRLADLETRAIAGDTQDAPVGFDYNHTILAPLQGNEPQPYNIVVKRAGETLPNEQVLRDQRVAILEVTAFDTFVQLIQQALTQWTGRPVGEVLRLELRDGRLAIYV